MVENEENHKDTVADHLQGVMNEVDVKKQHRFVGETSVMESDVDQIELQFGKRSHSRKKQSHSLKDSPHIESGLNGVKGVKFADNGGI